MLVCHVVSGLMFGGGQRVALDLLSGLDKQPGIQTLLVLLGDRIAPGFPRVEQSWQVLGYDGRYNRPWSLGRAALSLRQVLRKQCVDIVHSHGWDADVIAGLACRGLRVHHVVHQHILADWVSSQRPVHRARRAVTRAVLQNRQTHWVAVSRAVKESLRPLRWLPSETVHVIWNGVDLTKFRPCAASRQSARPIIGVAARLAPMKGLEYLIEAVALLHDRSVACQLRIAGDGPSRASLQGLVRARDMAEHVSFLGHLEDMPAFYRAIDVLALPSVSTEGMPLSILEAMASGLPVVSTAVSGIPEAVTNGVTGIIVAARDAGAFADAMETLLVSRQTRTDMGQQGVSRARHHFSLETTVEALAGKYRDLLSSSVSIPEPSTKAVLPD